MQIINSNTTCSTQRSVVIFNFYFLYFFLSLLCLLKNESLQLQTFLRITCLTVFWHTFRFVLIWRILWGLCSNSSIIFFYHIVRSVAVPCLFPPVKSSSHETFSSTVLKHGDEVVLKKMSENAFEKQQAIKFSLFPCGGIDIINSIYLFIIVIIADFSLLSNKCCTIVLLRYIHISF